MLTHAPLKPLSRGVVGGSPPALARVAGQLKCRTPILMGRGGLNLAHIPPVKKKRFLLLQMRDVRLLNEYGSPKRERGGEGPPLVSTVLKLG